MLNSLTHLKGGKNYVAVLVDIDKRKPIAILENRNKSTIAKCFQAWGFAILTQIEEVSIDLWKPYKTVVEELIPNARIVADRFHIMNQINSELDSRRKTEKHRIEKLKNKKGKRTKIRKD